MKIARLQTSKTFKLIALEPPTNGVKNKAGFTAFCDFDTTTNELRVFSHNNWVTHQFTSFRHCLTVLLKSKNITTPMNGNIAGNWSYIGNSTVKHF